MISPCIHHRQDLAWRQHQPKPHVSESGTTGAGSFPAHRQGCANQGASHWLWNSLPPSYSELGVPSSCRLFFRSCLHQDWSKWKSFLASGYALKWSLPISEVCQFGDFFFFPSYFGLKFYQLLPLPPPFSPVQLL